jgi:hypothetical protein
LSQAESPAGAQTHIAFPVDRRNWVKVREATMSQGEEYKQTALMVLAGALIGFSVAVILKLMLDAVM